MGVECDLRYARWKMAVQRSMHWDIGDENKETKRGKCSQSMSTTNIAH